MSTIHTAPAWQPLSLDRRMALAIDGVEARYQARPESPQDLADLLAEASGQGLAVTPVGGATQLGFGNPPARLDLLLDTTALDQVIEYEPADLTITLQAGVRLADLRRLLAEQGQLLPLDPPLPREATIGGILATNASGPLRYAFGTARDLVIGTRVANPDGNVTHAGGKVVKNVAGYDLNKLHVGALGTLGVLVEVSFKLTPLPEAEATLLSAFASPFAAGEFVTRLTHSTLSPLAIELLAPAAAAAAHLPAAWTTLVHVGGTRPAVDRQQRDLATLAAECGGSAEGVDVDTWSVVSTLALQVRHDVRLKAAVPPAESTPLVQLLESQMAGYNPMVWSHAGNGIAYAAFDSPDDAADTRAALVAVRQAVTSLAPNASLVIETCPPEAKAGLDVLGNTTPAVAVMRTLKQALDPTDTLNPGRYLGGI